MDSVKKKTTMSDKTNFDDLGNYIFPLGTRTLRLVMNAGRCIYATL